MLNTVANTDLKVKSSGMIQICNMYSTARPNVRIRICHQMNILKREWHHICDDNIIRTVKKN